MRNIIKKTVSSSLVVLFAASLGSCSQSAPDRMPETEPTAKAEQSPSEPSSQAADQAKMVFRGPGEKLPKTVADFSLSSAPRYFGPDNLYDLINGGAEIYVEYGLKEMVTADYRSEARKDLTVTVEVYDQGSLLGAFGRTARFLAGRVDPSDAGQGLPPALADRGVFGGSDIIYFKDRFLVHVTLLDESAEATQESIEATGKELLPQFAEAVAAKITDDPQLPSRLKAFPAADKIGRSEAYELNDAAGVKGLKSAFTARYKLTSGAEFTLFVTENAPADKGVASALSKDNEEALKAGKMSIEGTDKALIGYNALGTEWTDNDKKAALERIKELTGGL